MWHLRSILTELIRNIRLWAQQRPLFTSLLLHGLFLSAFCMRYITLVTLQVRRRKTSIALIPQKNNHPLVGITAPSTAQPRIVSPKQAVKKIKKKAPAPHKKPSKKESPKKVDKQKKKTINERTKEKPPQKQIPAPPPQQPAGKPHVEQPKPVEKPQVVAPEKNQVHNDPIEFMINNKVAYGDVHQPGPHEILYNRIHATWKPPRGVQVRTPCVVRIVVGKGTLEGKPEVISSSGSKAFDMSARCSLLAITYPQELWNRAIVIHFS